MQIYGASGSVLRATQQSGNVFDPALIHGIVKFAGKGIVFKNEYNKTMVYEPEPDSFNQDAIVKAVIVVLRAGKSWEQPDWVVKYAKAAKAREAAKTAKATDDNKGVNNSCAA
jgi:hypothetical protein